MTSTEADRLRLARAVVRRLGDHLRRAASHVAVVLARELADVRGRVVDDLAAEVLRDVLAAERDRRRRADVRLRRHRRDVRGHRDHGARRVRARAGWRDVDDDGHLGGEEALDDPAHRRGETARRVEDEHHRRVALVLGAVDGVLDVLLRDRVDVVVEVDGENTRSGVPACASTPGAAASAPMTSEREEIPANRTAWHRCKDSINGGSPPLSANGDGHPGTPRAPSSPHRPLPSPSLARAPRRARRTGVAVTTVELAPSGHAHVRAERRSAVHARRRAVARAGRVVFRTRSRDGGGAPGARRRRRPRTGPTRLVARTARGGMAARQSVVGGRLRPHPGAGDRPRRGFARTSCGAPRRASRCARRRRPSAPPIVPRCRGARTSRSGAGRRLRPRRPVRDRPPHGRPERLLAGRGGGDREGHPALPRAGERLERHRLQLSRRPLRDDLRGRFGGVDRNVVGAHALRVQHRLGRHRAARDVRRTPPLGGGAGRDRTAHRLAARPRARRPDAFLTFISGGSERYASGIPVLLNGVSGHRDTGFTECPGDVLYGRLGAIAATAQARRPQDLRAEGDRSGLRGPRPRAALAGAALDGRDHDASGPRSRAARVPGTTVDWTWDSAGAGRLVHAGRSRPARRVRRRASFRAGGGPRTLAIEALAPDPEAISPNGDGQADTTTLTYGSRRPRTSPSR